MEVVHFQRMEVHHFHALRWRTAFSSRWSVATKGVNAKNCLSYGWLGESNPAKLSDRDHPLLESLMRMRKNIPFVSFRIEVWICNFEYGETYAFIFWNICVVFENTFHALDAHMAAGAWLQQGTAVGGVCSRGQRNGAWTSPNHQFPVRWDGVARKRSNSELWDAA